MKTRILITGAGGPSAVSLIQALDSADCDVYAADMSPHASGLYLVAPSHRRIVPRGDSASFVDVLISLCAESEIDVLIPTVDSELIPVAESAARFASIGTSVMCAPVDAIRACLDKATLIQTLEGLVPVPRTYVLWSSLALDAVGFPCVAKPRSGSGSRGVVVGLSAADLASVPRDGTYIVQSYLPGQEYSVDVLCDAAGRFVAAVPRERMRVDSGVAVTARTVDDADLVDIARRAAEGLGLSFVSNVQLRRDALGVPRLLEINPRFPGTMPLTVASGVDMPRLALDAVAGKALPDGPLPYRSIAMVRTLREYFVDVAEIDALEAQLARRFGDAELAMGR